VKRIKVNNPKPKTLEIVKSNEDEQLKGLASALLGRSQIMARMGKSFGTARDIYLALGYTKTPIYADYEARFKRQDVAKRIVKAPVSATWKGRPKITEVEKKETQFEKDWGALVKEKNIFHHLIRLDVLAGIGDYAILLLGFDDGENISEKLNSNSKELLYLQPYSEQNASVGKWVEDTTDPRYGMPEAYTLQLSQEAGSSKTRVIEAHHSRVIHAAEGMLESNVRGTPRLECVLNRLQDLELVSGGSAEMFWRGAFPGYGFVADKDAQIIGQAMTDLEDEIEEYVHGLKRYLRIQGMTITELSSQVSDPSKHIDVYLSLISAATGIPRRILTGSERGELASTQDKKNWAERIDERREDYAEPVVLRPFVDKMIEAGVVAEPSSGDYTVEWPDVYSESEKERAEISEIKAKALAVYVNAMGADVVVPPDIFLMRFLGFTQEEVDQAKEVIEDLKKQEEKDLKDLPPAVPIPPSILPEEGAVE